MAANVHLVQPQRRENEEEFDEDRAERQDPADQHRHGRLHVPRLASHRIASHGMALNEPDWPQRIRSQRTSGTVLGTRSHLPVTVSSE